MPVGAGVVRFSMVGGGFEHDVLMGDGTAKLTGGDGGWTIEQRPGLKPVTLWTSPEPLRQTIPLMLDGEGFGSIESNVAALRLFSQPRGARQQPPALRISGPAVQRTDVTWVVESLPDEDGAMRREGDGERTRQPFVITLLEFSEITTMVERSPAKKARKKAREKRGTQLRGTVVQTRAVLGRTYVLQAGETLAQIAAKLYGDAGQWRAIASANKIRDPNYPGAPGRVLRIP